MMTTPTHAEILEGVLGRLTPDTWFQGRAVDPRNGARRCVLGHVSQAVGELSLPFYWSSDDPLVELLDETALNLFPERACDGGIIEFNDHVDTTYEDVRLVLKHAKHEAELALEVG